MPYKLQGNCVMKKSSSGAWVTVKCHDSREEAMAHMTALRMNVRESQGSQSNSKTKKKKKSSDY